MTIKMKKKYQKMTILDIHESDFENWNKKIGLKLEQDVIEDFTDEL